MTVHLFIVDEETGESRSRVEVPSMDFVPHYPTPDGCVLFEFDTALGDPADFRTEKDGDDIVFVPIVADPVEALSAAKLSKRAALNAIRDAKINGVCSTDFGLVDMDDSSPRESRRKLHGAVSGAMIALQFGQPFSVTWTMADDQDVTLDAQQTIAMGMAVFAFVDACHRNARDIKSLIDEAPDMAALEAIDISSGWPA
ncbi:DUF4376 domain-containing protein [Sphingobium lignivorans]|uniref:DUF4376 domain-containing protein n=1 Tax=Sphingobium lignivorans TaxID=2735886 RepID=A0ABR6NF76_9SPHN|nr:DUF4376 domain-containing protein [Sphingobium lignivorans]MBB5985938.1 hypothetical protein [Sphingobium lignivorans]